MRLTASIMRAAPTSASRRRGIGVGPACASWPVTVISYQRWPCAPVTTPIGLPGRFEDRPLLDMRLEIGGDRAAADRLGPAKPIRSSSAPSVTPVTLLSRPSPALGQIEDAGEHARADHRRREARALLVGPGDDLDRRLGLVAEIVQRAHHLEPGHHAVGAVELAAGRLGVEMAAGHDRRQARVAAGPAREDVADPVDRDGAAGLLAPADEEPPRLAVEIARREPAHPALRGRADLAPVPSGSPTAARH